MLVAMKCSVSGHELFWDQSKRLRVVYLISMFQEDKIFDFIDLLYHLLSNSRDISTPKILRTCLKLITISYK